jgi:hypothetical protein
MPPVDASGLPMPPFNAESGCSALLCPRTALAPGREHGRKLSLGFRIKSMRALPPQ